MHLIVIKLDEYAETMTADLGLPDKTVNMVNYAYTDYNGMNRYEDWFIRTNVSALFKRKKKIKKLDRRHIWPQTGVTV